MLRTTRVLGKTDLAGPTDNTNLSAPSQLATPRRPVQTLLAGKFPRDSPEHRGLTVSSPTGSSSQGSPVPSTSQHIWAPRSPWQGSPWSNAGVAITPGRGYRTTSTRWPTPGFTGSICGPGVVTRADISTPPQGQVTEFGGPQKLWHRSSRANRFVDAGTQTSQEIDLYDHDSDIRSSVRSITSAHSLQTTAPVYQFDSFPYSQD